MRVGTEDLGFGGCGHVLFEVQKVGIDGIKLATLLGIRENFMSLLNALEEGIIVGVEVDAGQEGGGRGGRGGRCFFIGMVFEHLFAVWGYLDELRLYLSAWNEHTSEFNLFLGRVVAEMGEAEDLVIIVLFPLLGIEGEQTLVLVL